jgi:putative membrane protein
MNAFFAFLHHFAAFALVAALAIEFVLIRGELTLERARGLLRVDAVYGAAAGALLVIGFLRVIYFEKGSAYYFHSTPFVAKLALFAAVGMASTYPTLEFMSWRKAVARGELPEFSPRRASMLRKIIHGELAGIVLILLLAALTAKGVGAG